MAFDAHSNLAVSTIATAPAPATSGTTLTVAVGEGARFPVAPFNCTVWPATALPTPVNAEVVRVTARTGDVLTITRAQEATTARSIVAGDLVAATITAKTITDIESGTNFPQIITPSAVVEGTIQAAQFRTVFGGMVYFQGHATLNGTADGSIKLGNVNGDSFDRVQFGGTTAAYPALKRSGAGLAVRLADDTAAADLSAANVLFTNGAAAQIRHTTSAGADTGALTLSAAGGFPSRGGTFAVYGNQFAPGGGTFAGCVEFSAGNVATGAIKFLTGAEQERGRIHASGGLSWGGVPNPGVGNIGAVAFTTGSDARLKDDRGRHTDPDVLRRTVIHDFVWKSDGRPGRGVFAQEAHLVAPFAVTVGTDEVDDDGKLVQPWGVDYSKYVPDLITGWQYHDAVIDDLRAQVVALVRANPRVAVRTFLADDPRPSVYQRIRAAIAGWFPTWITP
jgi:hypothetical protein